MRRFLSPGRLAAAGLILLAVAAILLFRINSGSYLILPDRARPLDGVVDVPGARADADSGGIYYVDVYQRRASLIERLFPGIHSGATLVPANRLAIPCLSESKRVAADRHAMSLSQQVATAVAYRALGRKIDVQGAGVRVDGVCPESNAFRRLEAGDVIVRANGRRIRTIPDLRRSLDGAGVGRTITISFRREGTLRQLTVRTIEDQAQPGRPVLGFIPSPTLSARAPVNVEFDLGNVGGPSAGLAFALQLLEENGRDVDRGYRVAATGELEPDGTVGRIGGVKQKTIGAIRSKVDVFLVPSDGGNAAEARRYARGLRILPVKSFQQALRQLATLPPKPASAAARSPRKDPENA